MSQTSYKTATRVQHAAVLVSSVLLTLLGLVGCGIPPNTSQDRSVKTVKKFSVTHADFGSVQLGADGQSERLGSFHVERQGRSEHHISFHIRQQMMRGDADQTVEIFDETSGNRSVFSLSDEGSLGLIQSVTGSSQLEFNPDGSFILDGQVLPTAQAVGQQLVTSTVMAGISPESVAALYTILDPANGVVTADSRSSGDWDKAGKVLTILAAIAELIALF